MTMIELLEVRKVFNMSKPNEFTALPSVSLKIAAHRVTVLKGPSGSGNSLEHHGLHGQADFGQDYSPRQRDYEYA